MKKLKDVNRPPKSWIETSEKIITLFIAVSTILFSVYKFHAERKSILEQEYGLIETNEKNNFNRELWNRRINSYTVICNCVSDVILSLDNREKLIESFNNYNKAYYGEGILVSDTAVDLAMIEFKDEVEEYLEYSDVSTKNTIRKLGLELNDACKVSIRNSDILIE